MNSTSIIGIVNQKGGTGKTTSCVNLGVDLANEGKKVLLVDCDPQGSLTISLGHPQPDMLSDTLADQMANVLKDEPFKPPGGILHHDEGALLTMVDSRTNNSREIASLLRETYGGKIRIFDAEIPRSVRAAEISTEGTSIFRHDPEGKVAQAYHAMTKEVLALEEQRQKHRTGLARCHLLHRENQAWREA